MTAASQKKADKKITAETITPQTPVTVRTPDLIAFHMTPAPKGKQPALTPIGAAIAHPDGEGFTLQLDLMPTAGGRILLRVPKAKKVV